MTVHKSVLRWVMAAGCVGAFLVGTGCKVYMPTLPVTPLVRQRGHVEAGIGVQVLPQVEGYVAYSPLKSLVVLASGAKHINALGGDYSLAGTQGDVGVGFYKSFGQERWLAGALSGAGMARTSSGLVTSGATPKDYRAAYNRFHGQLYLAWCTQEQNFTLGISGRATRLHFTDLTLNRQPVTVPVADLYGDYSLFARVGKGAFQAHVQVGGSTPLQRQFWGIDSDLYSTATLAGASLVFRPHLLKSAAAR